MIPTETPQRRLQNPTVSPPQNNEYPGNQLETCEDVDLVNVKPVMLPKQAMYIQKDGMRLLTEDDIKREISGRTYRYSNC